MSGDGGIGKMWDDNIGGQLGKSLKPGSTASFGDWFDSGRQISSWTDGPDIPKGPAATIPSATAENQTTLKGTEKDRQNRLLALSLLTKDWGKAPTNKKQLLGS